jgi:hypothetical protein
MKHCLLAAFAASILTGAASAQPAPPPVATITQEDVQDLNEVLQTTVPPRYTTGIVKWITAIIKRQQATSPPPEPPAK